MKKASPSSRQAGGRPTRARSRAKQQADIAARLERLDELRPESARAASVIRLLTTQR